MRRRLLTISIFLLAGAVVNVAVAWGIARWSDSVEIISLPFTGGGPADAPSAWLLDNVPEWWPDKPTVEETYRWRWFLFTVRISQVQISKVFGVSLRELRFGVPTKSLACYRLGEIESGPWTYSWRHAWGRLGGDTPLPLRPIWPGFAINTLFYATLLWLLIPAPFALRRFLRLKRGLCPKCAYPMGESEVCSECGCELPQCVRPAT